MNNINLQSLFRSTDSQRVQSIEGVIGWNFPKEYTDFLVHYNGGRPTRYIGFASRSGLIESDVQCFYGIAESGNYNLLSEWENLKELIPNYYLPIASDSLGNHILINLKSDEVCFFDHETNEIHLISDTFKEFIDGVFIIETDLDLIQEAVVNDNLTFFKDLVDRGVPVDSIVDQDGQSLVMSAAGWGKVDIVKFSLDNGADVEGALYRAATNGHVEVVKYLLSTGIDPDVSSESHDHTTSLMQACAMGHVDVVRSLVEAGADVHLENDYGQNALQRATWSSNKDVLEYLQNQL